MAGSRKAKKKYRKKYPQQIYIALTDDQYRLARRRMVIEGLDWSKIVRALINAYIAGDVSVTEQGRYHISPPSGLTPVIEIDKGADKVEIEPDWGINDPRPQVGHKNKEQHPRKLKEEDWGTKEIAQFLREETGRALKIPLLRNLMRFLEIPKQEGRWKFEGPEDENLIKVWAAIERGVYDALNREGTKRAETLRKIKEEEATEQEEADLKHRAAKKAQHLRRLRQINKTTDP